MLKKFTKTTNMIAQTAIILLHAIAQLPDLGAPFSGSPVPNILLAIAQAIIALRAHNVNPDGTPARLPYRPPVAD